MDNSMMSGGGNSRSEAADIEGLLPARLTMAQRAYTRRTLLRASAIAGLAGVSASFLAACSRAAPPAPQVAGNGTPRRGGTLRYGVAAGSPADTHDPHYPLSDWAGAWAGYTLFEPLTWTNEHFEFEQVLTESWEPNQDATEWVMTLKPGVLFHHGKTLDAEDVIFTVNRILDPVGGAIAAGNFAMVEQMEALSELTVRFTLNRATGWFPISVGDGGAMGIVPVGFDVNEPVSTGPFSFVSFTPGVESVWQRFDDYHGEPAVVDELRAVALPDADARVNALISGQVDAIQNVPASAVQQLSASGEFTVDALESGQFDVFTMRVDSGVTADVRVRQAVRLAVDREQILRVLHAGFGEVAHDLYGRWDPNYDTGLVRTRDLEQAKKLIAEAGVAGQKCSIMVTDRFSDMCQLIAENMREIGLDAEVVLLDYSAYFEQYLEWDLSADWYPSTWILTTAAMSDGTGAMLNQTHFSDEEYNSWFDQASAALDESERAHALTQMQRILFDRGGYLIPVFGRTLNAHRSDMVGWPTTDRNGFAVPRSLRKVGFLEN